MQAAVRRARACRAAQQQLRACAPRANLCSPGNYYSRRYYSGGENFSVRQGLEQVSDGLRSVATAIVFAGVLIACSGLNSEARILGRHIESGLEAHAARMARGREARGVTRGKG